MTTTSTARQLGTRRRTVGLAITLLLVAGCSTTLDNPRLDAGENPAADAAPGDPSGSTSGGSSVTTSIGASASGGPVAGQVTSGSPAGVTTRGPGSIRGGSTTAATAGPSSRAPGGTTGGSLDRTIRTSQGVTATTIKIGFMTTDAAGLQSVQGVNLGDNKVEAQAAVDWVNAHGGVAGRKIVPVFEEFSAASDNWERDYQGFCTSFAEDHKVFAVVGNTIAYSKTFAYCLAQHNTPLLNSAGGVQDRVGAAALARFLYTPGSFELTRLTATYVDGLQAGSFFGTDAKIGLIRVDDAPFARVTGEVLKPRLARLGLSVVEEAIVAANESLGTTASQMPNVVLRFQQEGINRVIVLDNGTLAISFSLAAASQGYFPRLGLNSLNNPILMQQNLRPESLAGSVGVGWQPTGDVDGPRDTERNRASKICDEVNVKAGQGNVDRTGLWQQRMYCDAVFFLQAALARPTEITPDGLAAGTAALGESFESAMTFRTAFPGRRLDGGAAFRVFVYDTSCSCFKYTGAARATG